MFVSTQWLKKNPKEQRKQNLKFWKVQTCFHMVLFFRPNSQNLGLAHGQGEGLVQQPPQQCGVCEVLSPVSPTVHCLTVLYQCVGHQGFLQTVHQNPQVTTKTESRWNIILYFNKYEQMCVNHMLKLNYNFTPKNSWKSELIGRLKLY